jgi:succinyl-CoA synthetase beta subunit
VKIHEYQAKQLLAAYGVPIPEGRAVVTVAEAVAAVRQLVASGKPLVALKAQIHAGGRGKGTFREHPEVRGVNVVTGDEVEAIEQAVADLAGKMLGSALVTLQTGPMGKVVNHLYIEQGLDIERELYLAVLLDRASSRNLLMASTEGGVEIERVADETPEKILRETIDPAVGLAGFQANRLGWGLGLEGDVHARFAGLAKALSAAAVELDADLVEVNPLVVTTSGEVVALDAKMTFDDSALYRHPEVAVMRDETEEEPAEIEARQAGISYIKLDGTIGCMVNGAGLAMATMDVIQHVGGAPANFLDVGGGASAEQVTAGFRIITRDPNVKGIFVNIFGGIMRCDVLAAGVVEAVRQVGLEVPLVVRLEGTNVKEGRRILEESGLNLVTASDMRDGAEKIVSLTR